MMSTQQLHILRSTYIVTFMSSVLLIIIFETGMLAKGIYAYDSMTNYVCEMIGIFLTIVCIPLALKLMSFSMIKRMLNQDSGKYFTLSVVRISLLALTLLYNVASYYLLGEDATLGYLALMAVVAFLFIWPSRGKMDYELENARKQQDQ